MPCNGVSCGIFTERGIMKLVNNIGSMAAIPAALLGLTGCGQ